MATKQPKTPKPSPLLDFRPAPPPPPTSPAPAPDPPPESPNDKAGAGPCQPRDARINVRLTLRQLNELQRNPNLSATTRAALIKDGQITAQRCDMEDKDKPKKRKRAGGIPPNIRAAMTAWIKAKKGTVKRIFKKDGQIQYETESGKIQILGPTVAEARKALGMT